jgi:hypothetical protein
MSTKQGIDNIPFLLYFISITFSWGNQMSDRDLIRELLETCNELQQLRTKIQAKQKKENPKVIFSFLGLTLVKNEIQKTNEDKIVIKKSKYEEIAHLIDITILQISIIIDRYLSGLTVNQDQLADLIADSQRVSQKANKIITTKTRKKLEKTYNS